jgi:hypothetical protein
MAARLAKEGLQLAYPKRRAGHEFIVTFSKQAKTIGVTAMDTSGICSAATIIADALRLVPGVS